MNTKKVRVESMPKYAPAGATVNSQEWNLPADDVEQGRELMTRIRQQHNNESKWYKIYINDVLAFNSELIKR